MIPILAFMEEKKAPTPEVKSTATKTIRLTRAEVYAMRLRTPRKKRLAFSLVGLLIAAALGNVLWYFQDHWLPFWLPPETSVQLEPEAAPPAARDASTAAPMPPPAVSPEPDEEAKLDFLSAALWDDPRFILGVRTFNQAFDRYRRFLNDRTQAPLLPQIETGAAEAVKIFEALRPEAPPAIPVAAYAERGKNLLAEIARLRQPAVPVAAAAPRKVPAEDLRRHPDFQNASRLFNQALEQFNQFKANTSRTELLDPVEDLARQAGEKFEALKPQASPSFHPELDRLIHQSYGLVSACRGARLKAGESRSSPAGGPKRRRPPLPAYQPPP